LSSLPSGGVTVPREPLPQAESVSAQQQAAALSTLLFILILPLI